MNRELLYALIPILIFVIFCWDALLLILGGALILLGLILGSILMTIVGIVCIILSGIVDHYRSPEQKKRLYGEDIIRCNCCEWTGTRGKWIRGGEECPLCGCDVWQYTGRRAY